MSETKETGERITKTDAELRELAMGLVAGTVFSDRHLQEDERLDMLTAIFMPLGLMGKGGWETLQSQNVRMFYEHLDKATGTAVNGYPTFFSMKTLTGEECDRMQPFINQLMAFRDGGTVSAETAHG